MTPKLNTIQASIVSYIYIYISVYICVKLSSENLNPDSYSPHSTNNYTFEMTIAQKMCSSFHIVECVGNK